ncbi:hypothetical protein [Corynebacterium senegalense]|uniref:hypothetical protein n=1 Tax=Corynebacterium senegalense TaxID=2080750 RepID=UPI000E200D31|nr:hypothetical protein [Corynebacterium senegalense]
MSQSNAREAFLFCVLSLAAAILLCVTFLLANPALPFSCITVGRWIPALVAFGLLAAFHHKDGASQLKLSSPLDSAVKGIVIAVLSLLAASLCTAWLASAVGAGSLNPFGSSAHETIALFSAALLLALGAIGE